MNIPVNPGIQIKCRLRRTRHRFREEYSLLVESLGGEDLTGPFDEASKLILHATRQRFGPAIIYVHSEQRPEAVLKKNAVGTHFKLCLRDETTKDSTPCPNESIMNPKIVSIRYEINPLGIRGPVKLTVIMPTTDGAGNVSLLNPKFRRSNTTINRYSFKIKFPAGMRVIYNHSHE